MTTSVPGFNLVPILYTHYPIYSHCLQIEDISVKNRKSPIPARSLFESRVSLRWFSGLPLLGVYEVCVYCP